MHIKKNTCTLLECNILRENTNYDRMPTYLFYLLSYTHFSIFSVMGIPVYILSIKNDYILI